MHLTGKIDNRDDGKRNSPGSTRFSNTSKKGLEKRKVSVPKHCFLEGCPDFLMFKYEQACDHCHVRRIRCDAAKPQCSHCVLYDKVCVYTPFIKKRQAQLRANRTWVNHLILPVITANHEAGRAKDASQKIRRRPIQRAIPPRAIRARCKIKSPRKTVKTS